MPIKLLEPGIPFSLVSSRITDPSKEKHLAPFSMRKQLRIMPAPGFSSRLSGFKLNPSLAGQVKFPPPIAHTEFPITS